MHTGWLVRVLYILVQISRIDIKLNLEDGKTLVISLPKSKELTWTCVVKGEYEIDPLKMEDMNKKMLLEKFQDQYEGFDFSDAQFNGNFQGDPKTFFDNMTHPGWSFFDSICPN